MKQKKKAIIKENNTKKFKLSLTNFLSHNNIPHFGQSSSGAFHLLVVNLELPESDAICFSAKVKLNFQKTESMDCDCKRFM